MAEADSALVTKVHVVDGASLRFTETGSMQADSWEIEWEATPAPAERVLPPCPSSGVGRGAAAGAPFESTVEPAEADPAVGPGAYRVDPEVLRKASPLPAPPPRRAPRLADVREAMPPVFRDLHPDALHHNIDRFQVFELDAEEALIQEGEKHPALVMVLRGELEASRGPERRTARAGELLGLTTMFGSGHWPTSLRTLSTSRLMVMERDSYQQLRTDGSRMALAIEEFALEQLLAGLQRVHDDLAQQLDPRPVGELMASPSLFARLGIALGGGGLSPRRVAAGKALAGSPLFLHAGAADLAALGQRFTGLRAPAGEVVIEQGEAADHMYLVVSGAVDALRELPGDEAVCSRTLTAGQLFGVASMLGQRPSPTTFVTRERTVLLELDKVAWAELARRSSPEGSILRLAVLRQLTASLVQASGQRLLLRQGGSLAPATLPERFLTLLPSARR